MELDKAIIARLNSSQTHGYQIIIPQASSSQFYYKQKLLPKSFLPNTTITKLPKLTPVNKSKPLFMTQLIPSTKPSKTSFKRIFSTCFKSTSEREYGEVSEVAQWLRDVVFLSGLKKMKFQDLGKHFLSRFYRTGEFIFRDQEPLINIYIILNGQVSLFYEKKKIEVRSLRDVIGENALIPDQNSSYSARAISEVHILYISVPKFIEILGTDTLKTKIDLMRILKSIKLFENISLLRLLSLSKRLNSVKIKKGTIIYSFNQKPSAFYVLIHGLVQENTKISEKFDEDIRIIKPNEFFGSRDLILNYPRRSSSFALVKSLIYPIPKELFVLYIKKCNFVPHDDIESIPLSRQSNHLNLDIKNRHLSSNHFLIPGIPFNINIIKIDNQDSRHHSTTNFMSPSISLSPDL